MLKSTQTVTLRYRKCCPAVNPAAGAETCVGHVQAHVTYQYLMDREDVNNACLSQFVRVSAKVHQAAPGWGNLPRWLCCERYFRLYMRLNQYCDGSELTNPVFCWHRPYKLVVGCFFVRQQARRFCVNFNSMGFWFGAITDYIGGSDYMNSYVLNLTSIISVAAVGLYMFSLSDGLMRHWFMTCT